MIFKRKTFNDTLALFLAVGIIPTIWILTALKTIPMPDIIIGATISIESLIVQFYFRKSPDTTTPPA